MFTGTHWHTHAHICVIRHLHARTHVLHTHTQVHIDVNRDTCTYIYTYNSPYRHRLSDGSRHACSRIHINIYVHTQAIHNSDCTHAYKVHSHVHIHRLRHRFALLRPLRMCTQRSAAPRFMTAVVEVGGWHL